MRFRLKEVITNLALALAITASGPHGLISIQAQALMMEVITTPALAHLMTTMLAFLKLGLDLIQAQAMTQAQFQTQILPQVQAQNLVKALPSELKN